MGAAGLEGLGGRRWWVSKVHGVLRCTRKGAGRGDVTGCKGLQLVEGWGKAGLAVRVTIWIGL